MRTEKWLHFLSGHHVTYRYPIQLQIDFWLLIARGARKFYVYYFSLPSGKIYAQTIPCN